MLHNLNTDQGPTKSARSASRRDVLLTGAGFAGAAALAGSTTVKAQSSVSTETLSPIVELRQYTLKSGARARFTALFEREFIEPQEAVGAHVIGQFRDLDDPDRFVWIRGFPDMATRAAALGAFYNSPLWKSKRDEANSSINDSDNVLLLRQANPGSGFAAARVARPPRDHKAPTSAVIMANLYYLESDRVEPFSAFFETAMKPKIEALGAPVIATFVTENAPNNFPRLPVRERDHVFVWFSSFASEADCNHHIDALHNAQSWRAGASDPILHDLARKPEILRLTPDDRSALRG